MAEPWKLTATENNAAALYPAWVGSNYTLYHNRLCLCNWYPLSILVEFAAASGFRLNLDYWPGRASTETGGERSWDTGTVRERDSHNGDFASKDAFKQRVESTVTARMIGTLNTVSVAANELRIGDTLLRNYNDRYWHVELITKINGDEITTEAGSTPKVKPVAHVETYTRGDLAGGHKLYQDKARRWDFTNIISIK